MHAPKTGYGWLLVAVGVLCSSLERSPAVASETIHARPELFLGSPESLMESASNARWYSLFGDMPALPDSTDRPRRRDLHLEITPFLEGLVDAVRQTGVPIQKIHGARARRLLGVSVSLKVSEDLPAVSFYARERSPELFNAFYPTRRGFSWAFVVPIRHFTFRLQGGKDSEFKYSAIAGVEWSHQARPLAIGVGMPMNLHGGGKVGGVLLLRVKF